MMMMVIMIMIRTLKMVGIVGDDDDGDDDHGDDDHDQNDEDGGYTSWPNRLNFAQNSQT